MLDQNLIFSLDVIDKDGNLIKNAPIGAYTKNISHNGNSLDEYLNTLAKASGADQSIALKNTVEKNKVVLTLQIGDKEVSTEFSPNDVENWAEIVGCPEIMPGTGASSLILKPQVSKIKNEASETYAIALGANVKATAYGACAFGTSNQATGEGSIAAGGSSTASGKNSFAIGFKVEARGLYAHAQGWRAKAIGDVSYAEGYYTEASAWAAHAEGRDTAALGANSHAEGFATLAEGNNAHAEGDEAYAIGVASHAEGRDTQARGEASHTGGQYTYALGAASFAHGKYINAIGSNSYAEGSANALLPNKITFGNDSISLKEPFESSINERFLKYSRIKSCWQNNTLKDYAVAYGNNTHIEGSNCIAVYEQAHAQGENTLAGGRNSFTTGLFTIAESDNSTVIGKYNTLDNNSVFIIGNGTEAERSDALIVDWDGNLKIQGSLTIGATPLEEASLQSLLNNNYTLNAGKNITFGYDEENKIITINSSATGDPGESGTNVTYSLGYSNNLLTLSGSDGNASSVNVLDFAFITQEEIDALFE